MKFLISFAFLCLLFQKISSQEDLTYFLLSGENYNKNIPTPGQFFNQKVGEWHLTHDQILNYAHEIARTSPRAIVKEYARSFENRPLVHVIFTSEENHKNLEALREKHLRFSIPSEKMSDESVPLVIHLGYGVHGNESSAANASVLILYHLAAIQGEKAEKLLKESIIIIDPCLNPDGLTRHSTWANMNQSYNGITNAESRQLREMWPGGRGSHYWFDLNRDYLLLTHPESKGRIDAFYHWLPNIVTDHHEMDANSTFFFQPGIKTRNNPLTPLMNYTLTDKIAGYHADYLDKIGIDYFSEEQFDDFYVGKGSSYPDINGGIGILFEQAGFRSRIRETTNGVRKLAYGIRNQFAVSLSTLDAAVNLRKDLLNYQKAFYAKSIEEAGKDPLKGYVFGDEKDRIKTFRFAELLKNHRIEIYELTKPFRQDGREYLPGTGFFVPSNQNQYRMVRTMFEEVKTFTDSAFYDVSTWTMPYAFDIPYSKVFSLKDINSGKSFQNKKIEGQVFGSEKPVAYVLKWNEYSAPTALYALQQAGLKTKVATGKFSLNIMNQEMQFELGTILIPAKNQNHTPEQILIIIRQIAKMTGIDFYAAETGLTPTGIDLGSSSFNRLEKPEIMLLTGDGTNGTDAGELWYLFDQLYNIPVQLVETSAISGVKPEKYNVIIMPGGSYSNLGAPEIQKLKNWILQGGTIILFESAGSWASRNETGKTAYKKAVGKDTSLHLSYGTRRIETELHTIAGAILNTEMDLSHPLCYGYVRKNLPVFKSGEAVAESLNVQYSEPVRFTANPYISGFVSGKNLERIKNAPVVSVQSYGQGKIITIHEAFAFRGIWLATSKLIANGVFFGKIIR